MAITLKRRALLKGAGTAALALPMLELTHAGSAKAGGGGVPTRYVFIYCGMSSGRDGSGTMLVPTTTGPGYDLPRSLWPLGDMALPYGGTGFGVQDEVSIVTGLQIPWGNLGETPPPGGKSPEFHYNTVGPLVSGMRGEATRTGYARGPSSDQIVAPFIADESHRHLVYRVQPVKYVGTNGGGGDAGRVSWRDDGGGGLEAIESNASPRLAFESLFSTFIPPDDTAALAALERRRKVLDMLRAKTETLVPKLGAADKIRMEQHFEEIKALESRIDDITDVTGTCQPPPDPGEDPPIGAAHAEGPDGNHVYTESAGYSDEETRAQVMFDLVHMAMTCDQARVAAVRMTFDQCFINGLPLVGAPSDVHELSHGATTFEGFADACGWHVKHFARFVQKLRDTQEFDGSSMLDHTAVVLVFEGGYGYDPEGDSANRAHSTENMVAMVAGRVGGLVPGQHIVASGVHPAAVTLSAMQAVGADVAALGEIGDTVPGLFG
jgi:hypothetical protein